MKSHAGSERSLCGGVWWCLECRAPADLADPGEVHTRCARCGYRRCVWQAYEEPACPAARAAIDAAPIEARPMLNVRRLPAADRPKLSEMATKGYLLCLACQQPTKRDAQECCVLCGSSQVEFQQPTLT